MRSDEERAEAGAVALVALGGLLVIVALIVGANLANGFALSYLWRWFMVPLGLPPIGLAHSIGVGIVVGFLTNHRIPKQDEKTSWGQLLSYLVLRPALALLVGWIVKGFM